MGWHTYYLSVFKYVITDDKLCFGGYKDGIMSTKSFI